MAKRPTRTQAPDAQTFQARPAKRRGQPRRDNGQESVETREPDRAEPDPQVQAGAESMSIAFEVTEEDIRRRAYQMYLERGGHDGADFDDWLRAEQELRAKGR